MRDTIFPLGCEIAKHAFKSLPETPNIGSSDPRPGNRSVSLVTATSPRGSFFLLTHSTRRGEADHQKDISLKRVRKLFVKSWLEKLCKYWNCARICKDMESLRLSRCTGGSISDGDYQWHTRLGTVKRAIVWWDSASILTIPPSLRFLQTAIYAIISLLRIRFHFPFTGLKSETFGPELYLSRLKTHVSGGAPAIVKNEFLESPEWKMTEEYFSVWGC